MAKLSEQLKALFGEWADNIRKEVDRIEMDTNAKVEDILALRNAIRENEDEVAAIEEQVRNFASDVIEVADEADNARDYAAYVADTLDEIEDYSSDDEDDEPIAYCDECGEAIYDEDDVVDGEYGEYCSEDCRAAAEDEDEEEAEEDEDEDEIGEEA